MILKVGGTPVWQEVQEKNFVMSLHFSGSESTISHFGKLFRDVCTVWSVSCLLFYSQW